MRSCLFVLAPLLKYTELNGACPVELSWHLMKIHTTSAYHVHQREFITVSMQPSSVAVRVGVLLTQSCHPCTEGDAPVRLAGGIFRHVQVSFPFQLSPGVVQALVPVICRNYVPQPVYSGRARQLFSKILFKWVLEISSGVLSERPKMMWFLF